MNWLDIVIILLVTIPTFFGYRKGFLRKLFGLLGLLVGFFLAVRFYTPVFELLSKVIKWDPVMMKVVSFLLIMTAVYLIGIWIATFMSGMNSGTKIADKITFEIKVGNSRVQNPAVLAVKAA